MTRAWVWLLSLLLGLSFTVGCDDPTVSDKAVSILQHGLIDAQLTCKSTSPPASYCNVDMSLDVTFTKLVDGGCMLQTPAGSHWIDRGVASTCSYPLGLHTYSISDGIVQNMYTGVFGCTSGPPTEPYSVTLSATSSQCTGFNLSAFGVTP